MREKVVSFAKIFVSVVVVVTILVFIGVLVHEQSKIRRNNEKSDANNNRYKYDQVGSEDLISNLGSTRFECHGSCVCIENEGNSRRSFTSSTMMTKSLTYLVAALSTSTAYHYASQYFKDACDQKMSESCSSGIVLSKVEDCEEDVSIRDVGSKDDFDEWEKRYEHSQIDRYFTCSGKCLRYVVADHTIKAGKSTKETQQLIKEITKKLERKHFLCSEIEYTESMGARMPTEKWINQDSGLTGIDLAEKMFMEEVLMEHCQRNSLVHWDLSTDDHTTQDVQESQTPFCVGYHEQAGSASLMPTPFNIHVKCVEQEKPKIEEELKNKNNE